MYTHLFSLTLFPIDEKPVLNVTIQSNEYIDALGANKFSVKEKVIVFDVSRALNVSFYACDQKVRVEEIDFYFYFFFQEKILRAFFILSYVKYSSISNLSHDLKERELNN